MISVEKGGQICILFLFFFGSPVLYAWCRRFSMLLWLHDCAPPLLIQASLVNTITMETALWQLHRLTWAQVHNHSSAHTHTHTMKDTCTYICYRNSRHVLNTQPSNHIRKLFSFSQVGGKCLITLEDTCLILSHRQSWYIHHNHYTAVYLHVYHSYSTNEYILVNSCFLNS